MPRPTTIGFPKYTLSLDETVQLPTRDKKPAKKDMVSALRDALDASVGVDVKWTPRVYNKTSSTIVCERNGSRNGGVRFGDGCCEYQGTSSVDLAGRRDESVELEALGDLIRHSATVSGTVEGVEGQFYGGVFVKVGVLWRITPSKITAGERRTSRVWKDLRSRRSFYAVIDTYPRPGQLPRRWERNPYNRRHVPM